MPHQLRIEVLEDGAVAIIGGVCCRVRGYLGPEAGDQSVHQLMCHHLDEHLMQGQEYMRGSKHSCDTGSMPGGRVACAITTVYAGGRQSNGIAQRTITAGHMWLYFRLSGGYQDLGLVPRVTANFDVGAQVA